MVSRQIVFSLVVRLVISFTPESATFLPRIRHQSVTGRRQNAHMVESPRMVTRHFMILNSVSSNIEASDFIKAGDGDTLQALFSKQCDKDGLMTKEALVSLPAIADLLSTGDLLAEELDDIWLNAPKFPDVEASVERIDVDSFIQIYRDIDDIFEDEDKEGQTEVSQGSQSGSNGLDVEEENDPQEAKDEQDLELIFKTICDDAGLVSKIALKQWSEIKDLIDERLLGNDEFDEIWKRTEKSPGSSDQLDVDGFLSFNVALDDLFITDDSDDPDTISGNTELEKNSVETASEKMFYGDDLSPEVIFSKLADSDFLVSMLELKKWGDLQDMLGGGDLLPIELSNMFDQIPKASGTSDKINEDGFVQLFKAIDDLFEDSGEEEEIAQKSTSLKADLLAYLTELNSNEDLMPCGLQSVDSEIQKVLNMAAALDNEPSNVISSGADIQPNDVAGDWELLYTTSSAVKFNKGISGLVPINGKFGSLTQKLKATAYLSDVEYIEKINAGPASFEVRVTGDWELRTSISIFTGAPSVALNVVPEKVEYGPTSTKGDHWKSLGPLNLLSFSYLDEDFRIMRGTTSTDTIFIFKRR